MRTPGLLLSVLAGLCLVAGLAAAETVRPAAVASAKRLPMLFEPNRGQADSSVRYLARGVGQTLFLADREATLVLAKPRPAAKPEDRIRRPPPDATEALALRIAFAGARAGAAVLGRAPTRTTVNHYVGSDRAKWLSGLPTYEEAVYRGLYAGVDLVFRPGDKGLTYDFHVAPGAEPKAIRLSFPTAEKLTLDAAGNLSILVGGEELRQAPPTIYQDIAGRREAIPGGYILRSATEVGFLVGSYDRTRPLVIDPTLDAATTYGGGNREYLDFAAFADGPNGDLFVAGSTTSADLYVVNPTQAARRGNSDGFVARFDASTLDLVYATYLGGDSTDGAASIAVAADGRAHLVGSTNSVNFPTTPTAAQPTAADSYVARLDPAGRLEYASYLGAGWGTYVRTIALSGNRLFIGGETTHPAFATTPLVPGLPSPGSRTAEASDIFIVRLDATSGAQIDARYLGGSASDTLIKLETGGTGELYGVGLSNSVDFPQIGTTPRPFGGIYDVIALKLSAGGESLVYSTRFGGNGDDHGVDVAVDTAGQAYVVGTTWSSNFPQVSPFPGQSPPQQQTSGFLVVLDPSGAIGKASYLGAVAANSDARAIAVGVDPGTIWVGGRTAGAPPAISAENSFNGYIDGFVANVVADSGNLALRSWSYVGGQRFDTVAHIAARSDGSLFVGGTTQSIDFPATLDRRSGTAGSEDIFVARLVQPADLHVVIEDSKDPVLPGERFSYEIIALNDSPRTVTGITARLALPAGCSPMLPLPASCTLAGTTLSCALGTLAGGTHSIPPLDIGVSCNQPGTVTATVSVAGDQTDGNPANNQASETTTVGTPNLLVRTEAFSFVRQELQTAPLYADDPIRFRTTVRNIGSAPATNVVVTNTAPAACTGLPLSSGPGAGTTTFALPAPLAANGSPGDRAEVYVSVRCPAGVHRNSVAVSAANEAATAAADGNRDYVDVAFNTRPTLAVELKMAPEYPRVGGNVGFAITVTNTGSVPAPNTRAVGTFTGDNRVVLYDRQVFAPATCTLSDFAQPSVRIDCAVGTLAPGERRNVVILAGHSVAAGSVRLSVGAEADGSRATADAAGFGILP